MSSLQSYLRNLDKAVKYRDISPQAREYAFQHWVAFNRCESADFKSEKPRCPLTDCDQDLDSLASYLQHITTCPQLKRSQYWCPFHKKIETFASDKIRSKRSLRHCTASGISKAACRMLDAILSPVVLRCEGARSELAIPEPPSEQPMSDEFTREAKKRVTLTVNKVAQTPLIPELDSAGHWRRRSAAEIGDEQTFRAELPSPDPSRPELGSYGCELIRSELPTPEPSSELSTSDRSLVPELVSRDMPHELPTSTRKSRVRPNSYRNDSLDRAIFSPPYSASIRSEMPGPDPFVRQNPRVPSFNTGRSELSTPDAPWSQAKVPSLNRTGLSEDNARQTSELVNVKLGFAESSGPLSNRRSELPRLSILTTQSSSLTHGHPTNATASLRYSEGHLGNSVEPPSFFGVGGHPQTVDSSGASSYDSGSSTIYSSLFDRSTPNQKTDLAEIDGLASPSSASSALDSPSFSWSAFKSPTLDKDWYHVQKRSESLTTSSGQTEVAPGSLPYHRHRELGSHQPQTFNPTTPQIPFIGPGKIASLAFAGPSCIPVTQNVLQDLIGRVIYLHQQCTSTLNLGTDRTVGVFGPCGYSSFKHGLQILQRIYGGAIPRTADAICALIQVALQFLSCAPSQASDDLWSLVRSDIHRWSLAIEENNARTSFLEAMSILWANWQIMLRSQSQPSSMPRASGTDNLQSAYDKEERPFDLAGAQLAVVNSPVKQCSLDQALRDSAIVQICSRFLDGESIAICV